MGSYHQGGTFSTNNIHLFIAFVYGWGQVSPGNASPPSVSSGTLCAKVFAWCGINWRGSLRPRFHRCCNTRRRLLRKRCWFASRIPIVCLHTLIMVRRMQRPCGGAVEEGTLSEPIRIGSTSRDSAGALEPVVLWTSDNGRRWQQPRSKHFSSSGTVSR